MSRPSAVVGPDVHLEVAALGDDVRADAARDDADVERHAGPAAVQGVEVAHDAARLEDRAAALLGLDAGMGSPAVDRDPGVDDPLAGRHDVAVGPGALEDEARVDVLGRRPDVGVDEGDPISSSGLAMNVSRSNGTPPSSPTRALMAYSPASRPDFMSVTPGP